MARGHIQQRDNGTFRVLVYAGRDPLTGKERRRTGTAHSRKEAEQLRTRLLSEIDQGQASGGGSRATMTQLLERWLETADLELTTRYTYQSYISHKIVPALGRVPVRKIDVETLDRFYAELRKRGGVHGQPLAAMTVRQVHFILRAALGLAVKWGWIPRNPAEDATIPRYVRQDVVPPTPAEVERFLAAAWDQDPDLGTLLWLAMVTGARRGELCALRWSHVRANDGFLLISRSFVHRGSQAREKDTKTHQARRVALDQVTAGILDEHKTRCEARAAACDVTVRPDGYVFSPTPDGSQPLMPDSATGRLNRLSRKLGVKVNLRSLRHYAATEMLTNGVDLRTTAGRLGHGDGGTTTLRVYTHFLPAPDLKAAEILANSVQRPPSSKNSV
ncbi:MAG: tyrosine-type recombinase/integrase [Egibacteraceae bacterium]